MSHYVRQPIDARSLDLGLRHLGVLTTVEHETPCAVCSAPIKAGTKGIVSTATFSVAHRACGEVIKASR